MYQDLCEEEKNKKQQYGSEWYINLSEDRKQRLAKYRKSTMKWGKIKLADVCCIKNHLK